LAGKFGRALVEEGGDAFLVIVGGHGESLGERLDLERAGEVGRGGAIQRLPLIADQTGVS